ncbi:uncharacterized protein [Hetaerina americana]|uniref:uncharacterized protein n=1 Tax=Hetaerina americana TaxID=62018 RepID=UPI003A7F4AE0
MAGVLFVVSLPTANFEKSIRNTTSEQNIKSALDRAKHSPNHNSTSVLESRCLEKFSEDQENPTSDANRIVNALGSKSVPNLLERMKTVNPDLSVSASTLQNLGTSCVVNVDDEKNKTFTSPQPLSRADSTEVLIGENVADVNSVTNGDPERMSMANLSRALGSVSTSLKALPENISSQSGTITSMEKLLLLAFDKLGIENAVWNLEKNGHFYQVYFSVDSGEPCEDCLQVLNEFGFGLRANTTVSVIPCTLFYKGDEDECDGVQDEPSLRELEPEDKDPGGGGSGGGNHAPSSGGDSSKVWNWNRFVSSVRARLTVAQVVESVRANAELTFDFTMLLLVAGMVAAMGLVENSSVTLVASMLISPLMGPILAGTFGTVVQDKQLQKIGLLNELLGLASCIMVGFLYGLVIGCATDHWGSLGSDWPTQEMKSRGVLRCLWVGVLIALPSGAGVALSVLGGNTSSLVGVAISASLLPPAVNAGLFWALAVIKALSSTTEPDLQGTYVYSENVSEELAMFGVISLCLTLVNIACIFVAAVLVLKVKEVAPQASKDEMRRFWKHDIKIMRDYNRTMHGDTAKNLGKQLLDELAGLPKEQAEAIVEEAEQCRQRLSLSRNISEGGIFDGRRSIERMNSNQHTWTPGTSAVNFNRKAFRRNSISVPSDEEVEDIVYSTLTAGSKLGYFGAVVRPGTRLPYRKISSTSWHGSSQIRSPTRMHTLEPQLDTIKESTSSLRQAPETSSAQGTATSKRFQVTPCKDDVGIIKNRKTSKAPLAKSNEC